MNQLTIALAQMDVALGEPERNLEAVRALVAEAKARGADLVVLPELWSTAYDLKRAEAHASAVDAGMFERIARLAGEQQIAVVGSLLESPALPVVGRGERRPPEPRVFNTATFVDASGARAGVYRKLHLVPMLEEDKYLTGGADAPAVDASFGKCALAICYDLRFPELWRHYALAGARLVLLCAEWPAQRIAHWRTLVPARAIENQFFVAATNRVGTSNGETFGGHSMVVNPWGEILVEGTDQPALLLAQIDLDLVDQVRERVPVFKDRRPDVYKEWQDA